MTLMELEYLMNNPSALGGIREGYMEGLQAHGYVLVRGSNAFTPSLELIIKILHFYTTRFAMGTL